MKRYDEEARNDHFRRITGRLAIVRPPDLRLLDGRAEVRRSERLSARERILRVATAADGRPIVAGVAASILHGSLWFDPDFDIELLHDLNGSSRHGVGKTTHRYQIAPSDVTELDGVLVTTAIRTAFEIGRIPPDWRGLGYLDSLHRATKFSVPALMRYIEHHRGWRHIRQIRAVAPLIDGRSESPPESWLRLVMERGDLPTPDLQISIVDVDGTEIARADLGYRREMIDIEYDGEDFHSSPAQRARDANRDAKLKALGWKVIRVDSQRLFDAPWGVLAEIEQALHSRGSY